MRSRYSTQKGFTILELMISTAVFSAVLLVILTAVTQIGRMYYKGITTAKTQEVARTVVERVSQEIQFSGASSALISSNSAVNKAICIGASRFIWKVDVPVTATQHALWVDSSTDCTPNALAAVPNSIDFISLSTANPTPIGVSTYGSELLPNGYRLAKLSISGSGALWTVSARVVYGADDLIESVNPANGATDSPRVPDRTVCKGSQVGTQFCSVSEITTTVLRRTL